MSTILSGEQLVLAHSKTNRELPPLGTKDFHPTHSWLEKKQIENALEQRKELLQEERVERQSCLMAAEWVPERHKAEVTLKNKNWEVFGHHSDSADWLFPEEVLYLMEMNCLECLFGEVPLSIQKGYSVLLHPEHGCSLPEYRVFAHLCRLGYRVARHWSDLTVTPYERQIRLDQHLDQRNTYSFRTSESELPRPDLPPKTVVELPEDTEISLESSSLVVNEESSITTDGESEDTSETRSERQPVQPIVEVIDVLDSSDESASDKSSSDDSDVEIIHESAPNINKGRNIEVVDGDSESDVEVIEVLNPKKEIIVETIDSSSDSEEVEQSSDSGSDKSHDGNWKRNSNNKRNRCQRPSIMNHYMFLSAHEFCVEKSASERSQDFQSASVENNESVNVNNNIDYPEHGGLIVNRVARPKFTVEKSRNEILDLMPSMGGHKNKLLPMSAPDLRLIPENIIPKQQSYTFSMNTLKARVFKPGFRGRFRGFPGPRYGNFNSYSNNRVQSFYPNQINSMSSFTPNPALAQMFGSDIHSMARGMMQFASSLLLNLPQNNQTNSLSPFSQQPSPNFHGRNSNYSQPGFSSHMQHSVFEPRNSRFNNSSYNSFNSGMNRNPQQFCTNNFRPVLNQDNLQRSLTPYSRLSDADFPERNFTPPPRPNNNKNIQRKTSYMPNRVRSRNAFRRNRSRQRLPPISPRTDDPAYIKPDVPFCRNPNSPQERLDSSIPLKVNSDVDMETIQIIDDDNLTPGRRIGTYMAKQKRSKRQRRREMNKKMRFDTNIKPEIIFLDSPLSNDSSADLLEVKNQANNVPSENNTSESSSGQNFEVKQESRGDSLEIKKEQTTQTIVKNEPSVTETSVKSENCCDISVKSEQNEFSNSQTEIKTESSSNSSLSVSTVSIETLVKSESSISFKSEPDVKLEESNIKHENSCHCHDIIPVKPYEVNKVKLENLSNVVSDNNVDTTVNANVSQQDQEVAKETSTISTSSVIHSEVPLSDEIQNNENLQLISNEMEVEESDDVLRNTSEIAAGTSIKNMDSEEEEISLSNVSSWAEVKKHNIPISNLPESITDKESGSDDEDGDEIKPLIRPKHCRTIGTVLSALQIFSPFNPEVPEDISKLKISFDMYLPSEFRKSQRGLPQYRIAVFKGCEPMPSAAQLQELQTRFTDNVPVLRAVVMPGSIVFYSCASVSLTVDISSTPSTNT